MKIRKKESTAILNSLQGGVVPSRGLEYIMVGRADEAKQILSDLDAAKKGASAVKFFVGPFGSGKSFIQALVQQIAFREKFAVAKADFAPERRLYGQDGKAVSLYTELAKNLSTATSPDGGALPSILEKWISDIQAKASAELGLGAAAFDDPALAKETEARIVKSLAEMDSLTGGYDFARVVSLYYKGFAEDDPELQRKALRWLRGEYGTKTEARSDLGVRSVIDDANWYDYLKVLCQFVRKVGYSGLVVNLDEAINLYKITNLLAREKNYETILRIFNDTMQGSLEGLYIAFGGTPEFLEDERRGLFSYGALKRRLAPNRLEAEGYRDLSQPVIKLSPLKHEETYVLLQKLRDIHAAHYEYESGVSDSDIQSFMKKEYARPGAEENLTAGDVIRSFLGALNILHQNPSFSKDEAFGAAAEEPKGEREAGGGRMSRFQRSE